MRSVTCRSCGKSFTEAQKEWDHAYATGECPFCGKFLDQAREDSVAAKSKEAAVSGRATALRSKLVYSGLLCLALALAFYLKDWSDRSVVGLGSLGAAQLIYGLAHSARKQARQELKKKTDLDRFAGG